MEAAWLNAQEKKISLLPSYAYRLYIVSDNIFQIHS